MPAGSSAQLAVALTSLAASSLCSMVLLNMTYDHCVSGGGDMPRNIGVHFCDGGDPDGSRRLRPDRMTVASIVRHGRTVLIAASQ